MNSIRALTLSRITGGILLTLGVILLITLYWGINETRKPYNLILGYVNLTEDVYSRLNTHINEYLKSGNALELSAAEADINQIIDEKLALMPDQIASDIRPSAEALRTFIQTDLRAAGKLAGDPQGLLLQNEREMRDQLSSLNDYVQKSESDLAGEALAYSNEIARLFELVFNISSERVKLFETLDEQYKTNIESYLEEAKSRVTTIDGLTRLGVKEESESEDDFADMLGLSEESEEESGDLADDYISELSSLLSRYNKELNNTQQTLVLRRQSLENTQTMVNEFEQGLSAVVPLIDDYYQEITGRYQAISFTVIGLFILAVALSTFVMVTFVTKVRTFLPPLRKYAEGDLSTQINVRSRYKEIQDLQTAVSTMHDNLIDMIKEIRHEANNIQNVCGSLEEMNSTIQQGGKDQEAQILQSTTAVNEMNASFREVAQNAAQAANAAENAENTVNRGSDVMGNTIQNINQMAANIDSTTSKLTELKSESSNIESVLAVIESVAEQTNLLALNAAIEAARAGEHGRGFAVVADEVRQLAQRTTDSTEVIKSNVAKLREVTDKTVHAMSEFVDIAAHTSTTSTEAEQAFRAIVEEILSIRDMNTLIASATEEQLAVSDEIDKNISHISMMANQSVTAIDNSVQDTEVLSSTSRRLVDLVSRFRVDHAESAA